MIFVVEATGRRVWAFFAQSTWPVSASTTIAEAAASGAFRRPARFGGPCRSGADGRQRLRRSARSAVVDGRGSSAVAAAARRPVADEPARTSPSLARAQQDAAREARPARRPPTGTSRRSRYRAPPPATDDGLERVDRHGDEATRPVAGPESAP